jgi:predicted dinucleotide-binding enzyme
MWASSTKPANECSTENCRTGASELVERAGLDPVVVGGLSTSKLFDVGAEVYATSAPAREIRKKLNLKPAGSKHAA